MAVDRRIGSPDLKSAASVAVEITFKPNPVYTDEAASDLEGEVLLEVTLLRTAACREEVVPRTRTGVLMKRHCRRDQDAFQSGHAGGHRWMQQQSFISGSRWRTKKFWRSWILGLANKKKESV